MPKRILQGTVVSDAMDKSIVVRIDRRVQHAVYKKFIRRSTKLVVHDADNDCKVGDIVRIQECPPKSKRKRWEVLRGGA